MEVTLKKASALVLALAGTGIVLPHSVNLDIYGGEPTPEAVVELTNQFNQSVSRQVSLVNATYTLRQLIGEANAGKINSLLTERAHLDKLLSTVGGVPLRDKVSPLNAIRAKMQASREGPQAALMRGNAVTLELETASIVTPMVRSWKKRRLKVEDELANLNHTIKIQIPDDVVELLKEYDLV